VITMNVKKIQYAALLVCTFLVMGVSTGTAATLDQGNSGNYDYENDNVHIQVTGNGNVPKYNVWNVDDNETVYKVFFNSIFTANDTNDDGVYHPDEDQKYVGGGGPNAGFQAALPSSSWDFSEVTENDDGSVDFDISSSDLGLDGMTLELRNHIGADASEIKFDVFISGFDFSVSPNSDMLVFVYTLSSTAEGEASQDGNSVSLGDGYFESEPLAQDDNGDVEVGMWANTTGSSATVYIAYNQWSGDLLHDPTVGVQASAAVPDDTTTVGDGPNLADASDEEDAGLTTFFASFIAVVVPFSLYRRR